MLGLVLFTVAFIYYFRRQAWSAHSEMNSKYRMKNKSLGDPKVSKGGLFSFDNLKMKKHSKVGGEDDGDEKIISKSAGDDIENSIEYPNDFNDDIQLPHLARSMQSQHDEIDKQLIDQNALLNNLQNIFRKEVDDLKCLLSTTKQTETNPHSDNKNKSKIIAVLNDLKNDTNSRKFYENNLDSAENKIDQLLRNLLRLLTDGPSVIADEIVEQISIQIFDKIEEMNDIDGGEEKFNSIENNVIHDMKNTLCLSFTLQNLYNELEEIRRYTTDCLLPMAKDEIRRKELRENIFEANLNNIINDSLSPIVLEHITMCREREDTVDRATDGVNHVYSAFVQRTPKFVTAMNKGVEVR